MRPFRPLYLASMLLGFSCGGAPADADTNAAPVSAAPPVVDLQTPSPAEPEAPSTAAWSFHGFHGAWAIFAQEGDALRPGFEEPTTVVVHVETMQSARFTGRPAVADPTWDERPYAFEESPSGRPVANALTARNGRLLVLERKERIEVADLRTASVVRLYEGPSTETSFGADGHALIVEAPGALHVLSLDDTRRADLELDGTITSSIEWNARGARFYAGDAKGWQFFDRTHWAAWPAAVGTITLQSSSDGAVWLLRGSVLERWNLGDTVAQQTIAAPKLAASAPTEDFFEIHETPDAVIYSVGVHTATEQRFDFHVASLTGQDEVVFRGIGECGQSPERIVSVDEHEIVTDVSCSLGCPSDTSTPEHAVYDRKTGALLRQETGPTEPSYNERQVPASRTFERDLQRLALSAGNVLALPGEARRYLHTRDNGLVVTRGKDGTMQARLVGTQGLLAKDAVVSAHGAYVALPSNGGYGVWSTRSGALVFTVGPDR